MAMEVFEIKKSRLERQVSSPSEQNRRSNAGYLLVIAGLVLITSTVLVVLHFTMEYVTLSEEIEVLRVNHAEKLEGEDQCHLPFCDSRDCVAASARILKVCNFEVDPCEDFYEYACGRYPRVTSVPYGHDSYSSAKEAQTETLINIRKSMAKPPTENEDPALQKLRAFYGSCENTTRRSEDQNASLVFWLNDNGLAADSFVMGDELDFDGMVPWRSLVSRLEEYQIHTIFRPKFVEEKNSAPQKMEVDCTVPYLQPEAYLNTSDGQLIYQRTIYKEAMEAALKQIYMGKQERREFIEDVLGVERNIAEAIKDGGQSTELSEEHEQQIKEIWHRLIGDAIQDMEIVSSCKYDLSKILTVLDNTPQRTMLKYLIWRMLAELMQYLGDEFHAIHLHYMTKLPRVDYAYESKWQECAEVARSDLGLATTKLLFENGFLKTNNREELNNIFQKLKTDFINAIEENEEFTEEIKGKFADKLRAMKLETGYTDIIHQDGALETIYRNVEFTENYFINVINLKRFKARHHLTRLWYPNSVDPLRFPNYYGGNETSIWLPVSVVFESLIWTNLARNTKSSLSLEKSPLGSESGYGYESNTVHIDLGLLSPPLFRFPETIPLYALYGLYSLIAKEMTKAFDSTGCHYNAQGERTGDSLWPTPVNQQPSPFAACLQEKEGQKINVNNTELLNEIISDIGAFRIPAEGLKRHLRQGTDEKHLPGVRLDRNQTVFVLAAQAFCEMRDTPAPASESKSRIPTKLRVNSAVSNLVDFGMAFQCPLGSAMNPGIKCNLF